MKLTPEILIEQANIARRAERLYEYGYRLTVVLESPSGNLYRITSPEGNEYLVSLNQQTCIERRSGWYCR